MLIDLVFFVLMILAIVKGISKGLIVAIFSFFAFIIGLAAALKLSAVVANYLRHSIGGINFLLPFISFLLVFVAVALVIKWGAVFIKKAVNMAFLGWIDTIGGILLYALMYTLVYSVILFFATKIHLVSAEARLASKTYSFVEPLGPKVMSGIGIILPFFSHMFADLSNFFEGVASKSD